MTELIQAILNYDTIESVSLINKGCSLEGTDEYKRTALHISCEAGLSEISQYLLKNGINIHIPGEYGNYPIHCAVLGNDLPVIKKLIKAGQSPDIQNNNGDTGLHLAVQKGFTEIINYLAPISSLGIKNKYGNTPILNFSSDTLPESIIFLIENGACSDDTNYLGKNLLHLCAENKYFNYNIEDICYIAENLGVDPYTKDLNQNDAFEIALHNLNSSFFKMFYITRQKKVEYFVQYIKNGESVKFLDTFFDSGFDINEIHEGKNFLFYTENIDFIEYMIEKGIGIDFQDINGISRLHLSVLENNYELSALLLKSGINAELFDQMHNRAIHFSLFPDKLRITQLLLSYNVETYTVNKLGIKPNEEIDFEKLRILEEKDFLYAEAKRI